MIETNCKQVDLSFVIPCYRSEKLVTAVIDEIKEASSLLGLSYEIVLVNDCSPDNVWEVLRAQASVNSNIKAIDLAKNMGKHAALMAGFAYTTGTVIVCADDDGQCPIDELPRLLAPLGQGYDIVLAKYLRKKQSAFKNFGSRVNALMAQVLIGKPKELQISNFSAMRRFVCDEILQYKNPYPYIDGLFLRTTSRIANVTMEARARLEGTTGYTFFKSLKLWLNGFTAFSVKPLRIATVCGMLCAAIGFLFGLWVVINKLIHPMTAAGYSSLMAVLLFIGGMLMLMLGLIGEYVGRIYISINSAPQYVIRETVNFNDPSQQQEAGGQAL